MPLRAAVWLPDGAPTVAENWSESPTGSLLPWNMLDASRVLLRLWTGMCFWVTESGHPVRRGKVEISAAGGRRQTCLQTWALTSHVTLGKLHKLSNIHFPHLQKGANNSACFV